jgi:hypothetical protein
LGFSFKRLRKNVRKTVKSGARLVKKGATLPYELHKRAALGVIKHGKDIAGGFASGLGGGFLGGGLLGPGEEAFADDLPEPVTDRQLMQPRSLPPSRGTVWYEPPTIYYIGGGLLLVGLFLSRRK